MQNEKETIERILNGDLNSFKIIVSQHETLVIGMIRRIIKDQNDIDDLCQEVFIKVFKSLHSFKYQSKISTWIGQIAFNTAVNHVKKVSGKKHVIIDLNAFENSYQASDNPESLLVQKSTSAYIQEEVAKLPLPYRTILTLYHLQELSYIEIGEITGLPDGTVKSYLFRARKLLKDKLAKHLKAL
ncbi:MAG TPA: sigma-70 family RNA polymerase sigma factor [Pedobacter sp.]|uniref:RNA polymerase sigma factor n=1 Tax=Pedobacter sp. TaxID=1411316 RepID=UPI002D0B4082|nr:sigma-70 family RNA polymerase sigma factor [Pedobacter sp.]HMI04653.1 sigma-70 family RNA polymerase sigma factor [Pedobacter sp.]